VLISRFDIVLAVDLLSSSTTPLSLAAAQIDLWMKAGSVAFFTPEQLIAPKRTSVSGLSSALEITNTIGFLTAESRKAGCVNTYLINSSPTLLSGTSVSRSDRL